MIQIDNSDITEQHSDFLKSYASAASAPLVIHDFIAKSFPKLEERAYADRVKKLKKAGVIDPQPFPYEVKIPKSLQEMIDGDFEPKKLLRINEPIKGPYSNIWFGDTTDGIFFRWGYVNGDSRKISTEGLNDKTVHGFLGGATGTGKSVTMNAIIFGACMEYPPWELTLTLSDAKIVEFKTIATSQPMPHIDIVAATSDVDYMLSMLEEKRKEMKLRQSVFTKAAKVFGRPIKNIMEFREVTGLCMPRVMMVFDECTAMFQNAGKRANKIGEAIDNIARLGRNAGFHLLLASQEISSDLPDKTMANLTLRGAMGCTGPISEKILGNDEAVMNLGQKGKLITNTSASQKNNKPLNVAIRVPWLPPESLNEIANCTIKLGKELGVTPVMRFYDEEEQLYEDKYIAFVESFEQREDRIILGPPSFIMEGDEQAVTIKLIGKDIENICVFANKTLHKIRALKMLMINFRHFQHAKHILMYIDPMFKEECNLDELNPIISVEEHDYETSNVLSVARALIYKRMLMTKADEAVFRDGTPSETGDAYFYQAFEHGSVQDTVTNRVRFKYYMSYMQTDTEIVKGLQIDTKNAERMIKLASSCIELCADYGCTDAPVTKDKLPAVFFWIFGMERLNGIGRDSRGKLVEDFKKLLFDCTTYAVRFIVFSSKFEDTPTLAEAFGSFLLEEIGTKQRSNIKCSDVYPEKLSSSLMMLFKPQDNNEDTRLVKYKKLMMEGEI